MLRFILNSNLFLRKSVFLEHNRLSSSSSKTSSDDEPFTSSDSDGSCSSDETNNIDTLRSQLLHHSLPHVIKHGWSKQALAIGASECGMSPMAHGLLENGEFLLVDHFYKSANKQLREYLQLRQNKSSPPPPQSSSSSSPQSSTSSSSPQTSSPSSTSSSLQDALKFRLQLIIPYIHIWPEAMTLMSQPQNVLASSKNLMEMVDDVWFYAGADRSTEFSWYTKRVLLACIYKSTELSLISDLSPNYGETWMFMERRFSDVEDFTKCSKQMSQLPDIITSLFQVARNISSVNNLNRSS